ncbi:DNA polymerase III subunit beta [Paenibacillus peoriae]|uniref:DNA polymerase III subunit beta n=1 Tax=Paenibacillus peoriae TaxID=59893 RepID=UPI00096F12DA|nr:DNA polymerase III subunit beta [Paenibacillus peoriae]OMF46587.1 DNA polymerase III subunit beta [Paenibacillus peoriae]
MNIVVDSALLAEALEDSSKAISAKSIMPILGCFLIEANQEGLTVTGTDDRATIQSYIFEEHVQIERSGKVVLPELFLKMLKKLSGDVRIESKDGMNVIITSRNKEIEMAGLDPEEFPLPPTINDDEYIEITGKDLRVLFKKAIFAADIDGKGMPILTGANVYLKDGKIGMEATNRHRLSKAEKDIESGDFGSAVIEARGLVELQKIIADKDDVQFGFSKGKDDRVVYAFARTERFTFYSRVLEGEYPDIHQMIIVPDSGTRIEINKQEFLESVELIYTLAKEEKNNMVKLDITEKEINIRGKGKQTGKASESIVPTKFTGQELSISLNSKYAIDALKALDGEKVTLVFAGKTKSIFILSNEDNQSIHVVQPYRTVD